MVKRLISTITCLIFIVDSSSQYSLFSAKDLPGYNLLRPAAFKNSNQKSSSSGTIVIDTEELDLKKSRAITVQEMLSKFAQKHPEIIKDPEAVLIVMREQDAKLIFKLDFNNKKGAPVKKGERYRIAYEHPLLRIDTRLPLPRGIWVSLGGLTPREKETFEDILSTIGKIRWRSKFISTLLTEKWIEKEEAEGVSKVEVTKKLLLYYYKEFGYKPGRYDDKVAGLYFVLNVLLQDKEVDKFLSQLVKAYYAGGEEAYVKDTHFGGEKVFVDDFDFLLSLFINRENNDIHSIAVHSVMEAEGFSKGPLDTTLNRDESRLPLFAQEMLYCQKTVINRAILLKLLQYDRGDNFLSESSAETKPDFLKDPFMQNLIRDMFRFDTLKNKKTEVGIMAFGQHETMDNLARIICKIGETAVSDFMDIVMREDDRETAEKMAYFLDRLAWILSVEVDRKRDKIIDDEDEDIAAMYIEFSKELLHKWVDVIIHLATKQRIFMKQTYYLKKLLKDILDYRRQDLEEALIPLLEDTKRNDVGFILDVLSLYKYKRVQNLVIAKHLKKNSPHLGAALKYLYRLKDPKSFEDVWRFLVELESSKKEIKTKDLIGIGRYFVELLNLKDEEGLSSEQKQRIKEFSDKHILNQNLGDLLSKLNAEEFGGDLSNEFLPDESWEYTEKISFIRVWLSLAGIFKRDDRYREIMQAAEKSLKFTNILDVSLEALLSLSSDESYEYLKIFAISILLEKEKDRETVVDPLRDRLIEPKGLVYESLSKDMRSTDPARRRKLFVDLIDLAILNQSNEVFDGLLHTFISTDPKGALDTLNSGKWFDVDLSNIDPDPLVSGYKTDAARKIYSFKGLREYFLKWYFAYIMKPKLAKNLQLLSDEDSTFWERVRFGLRVLLLIELGLIGDEEKREELKIEFLIDAAFKNSGWRIVMRTEERLSALVALKPVVDIMNLDIGASELKKDFKGSIWRSLIAHDPTFYNTLEKQMKVYLGWLIKEGIITRDYKTALDRFGAYFLKKKPEDYEKSKLCDYEKAEKRMERFEKFLRINVLQFFYPEEKKQENSYDFTRQLVYTLVSILSKYEQRRKDSSVDARPIWPMFILPPGAVIIRKSDEGYRETIEDLLEPKILKYLNAPPVKMMRAISRKAIDSSA